jgi:hypothetical protein
MAQSIKDIPKKKLGRPSTGGRREGVMVRLEADQFEALDAWSAQQKPVPSRPEAIRRLFELGLTVKAPAEAGTNQVRQQRARELAVDAIDKMGDSAASSEERAQRRRRLTKGPEEFREVRKDRSK